MTTVYLVINEDGHYDTDVAVFDREVAARVYARRLAIEQAHELSDIEERDVEGWLYYATYAPEGRVWVVAKPIHHDTQP